MEGRLIATSGDPAEREGARQQAIDDETVRVIARRGPLRIVETRHGLVMAAAGVDASNVAGGEIALLPTGPGRLGPPAARRDRRAHRPAGRGGRLGLDGPALAARHHRRRDRGRGPGRGAGPARRAGPARQPAGGDRGGGGRRAGRGRRTWSRASWPTSRSRWCAGWPVAGYPDDGRGAAALLRDPGSDLFRMGTAEALALGRGAGRLGNRTPGRTWRRCTPTCWPPWPRCRWTRPTAPARPRSGKGSTACWRPGRTPPGGPACPATSPPARCCWTAEGRRVLLTLHPRVGAWLQLGGHLEDTDPSLLAAAAREAAEESGIAGIVLDPVPVDLDVQPDHLLAGPADPALRRAVRRPGAGRQRARRSAPSPTTCAGST